MRAETLKKNVSIVEGTHNTIIIKCLESYRTSWRFMNYEEICILTHVPAQRGYASYYFGSFSSQQFYTTVCRVQECFPCFLQVSLNPAVVKGMAEMATLKKQNKRLQDKMVR